MSASNPDPGPDADAAFTLGLTASVVLALCAIVILFQSSAVTPLGAIALTVSGLPVVFIVASCLLAMWLGYDKDAVDAFGLTESLQEHTEE